MAAFSSCLLDMDFWREKTIHFGVLLLSPIHWDDDVFGYHNGNTNSFIYFLPKGVWAANSWSVLFTNLTDFVFGTKCSCSIERRRVNVYHDTSIIVFAQYLVELMRVFMEKER
jgi:hypothetical protein